jgi:pyruvate dehydrogenase complex dehydrogenase (E1) component
LRKLTFSQGRLLIKLIDRETGDTSYKLIKELKGGFSAFMWQSVARIFGSNLKSEYEMEGDDAMIERIIIMIDNGML